MTQVSEIVGKPGAEFIPAGGATELYGVCGWDPNGRQGIGCS